MIEQKKGLRMSETNAGAVRAKIAKDRQSSPVLDEEILDWDVPSINSDLPSDTIRVRVRDVEPEPIQDI